MKLQNKRALITGGSSGIGQAIAERFINEGAEVLIFGSKKPEYKCEFYQVDTTNEKQIEEAFQQITHLDILVNNAGIYFQTPFEKLKEKTLRELLILILRAHI